MEDLTDKILLIRFDDHALNIGPLAIPVVVYGRVISDNVEAIQLVNWDIQSGDPDVDANNRETVTIVKGAIKEIIELGSINVLYRVKSGGKAYRPGEANPNRQPDR